MQVTTKSSLEQHCQNMACFTKAQLGKCLKILKAVVTVLIIKVGLGLFDVGSDIVNGYNFLSGYFKLALYFASLTREDYDQLPDLSKLGYPIILLPWLPGLLRIIFLVSSDINLGNIKWIEVFRGTVGYSLLLMTWPFFFILK